jgi:hypothetical protein
MPVKLSESQEATIDRLGKPLQPVDRERYRERVYALLSGYPEVGDGLVNRVAAAVQRETLVTPPPRAVYGSKWGRHAGAK